MNVSPAESGTLVLTNLSTDEVTLPVKYPEAFTCFFISHTVSAQANAKAGYQFDRWTLEPPPVNFKSGANPLSFVNDVPRRLTAVFKAAPVITNKAEKISAVDAKDLLDSRADIVVIDIREALNFDAAHLVCAFNYPWVSGKLTEKFSDFSSYMDNDILVYDQDGTIGKAAADFLAGKGFSSVDYMTGGMNAWQNNGGLTVDSDCNCEACGLPSIANAGPDQTVTEGDKVTLNAEGSASPLGTITTYKWEQFGGQTVLLSNPASARPAFTAPYVQQGGDQLIFHVTVTDSKGNKDTDSVAVSVNWFNDPPTADAGADLTVEARQTVVLDGSGSSDPEGLIAGYLWEIEDSTSQVTLSDNNILNPSFTAPGTSGWLRFRLTVTDADGKTDTDSVTITIGAPADTPPEADAGSDQTMNEGELIQLSAAGSADPGGMIKTYYWEQVSGPEVALSDEYNALPTFYAPPVDETTELVFLLTVTDNNGGTDTDEVVVTVNNINDCTWNAVDFTWDCADDNEIIDDVPVTPSVTKPVKTNGNGSFCFISSAAE